MKETPLLYKGEMVRGILEDRKHMTRRVMKIQPSMMHQMSDRDSYFHYVEVIQDSKYGAVASFYYTVGEQEDYICPYGGTGDRIWVKENFWMDRRDSTLAVMAADGFVVAKPSPFLNPEYTDTEILRKNQFWKLKPSIFMPRWASRITLEITDVRVERLNMISYQDALAEGVTQRRWMNNPFLTGALNARFNGDIQTPEEAFKELWNNINGKGSWDLNPWVWVIEFKRICSTESKSDAMLPPIGQRSETPRGLGRDGNKPLMRNREVIDIPSPISKTGGNTFQGGSR